MTDAELDDRVSALDDADLKVIALDQYSELAWYRSIDLRIAMAKEILSLREKLAAAEAEVNRCHALLSLEAPEKHFHRDDCSEAPSSPEV